MYRRRYDENGNFPYGSASCHIVLAGERQAGLREGRTAADGFCFVRLRGKGRQDAGWADFWHRRTAQEDTGNTLPGVCSAVAAGYLQNPAERRQTPDATSDRRDCRISHLQGQAAVARSGIGRQGKRVHRALHDAANGRGGKPNWCGPRQPLASLRAAMLPGIACPRSAGLTPAREHGRFPPLAEPNNAAGERIAGSLYHPSDWEYVSLVRPVLLADHG